MSVGRMRAVTRLEGLTATQKSVLFVLADFEDDETDICLATIGVVAHFAGCTTRTVFRVIRALETKGLLTRKAYKGLDYRTANVYVFGFKKVDVS